MKKNSLTVARLIGVAARTYRVRYVPLWLASMMLLGIISALSVNAVTSISQSYATSSAVSLGSIVSLQKNTTDEVVAAGTSSVDSLLGVVISADNALISLSAGGKNQVQVATSGIVQVLVSDISGSVTQGDHITASPLSGIGMKATGNVRIIGIAQGDLTGTNKQTYKDSAGHERSVVIGQVPVLVNVAYFFREPDRTLVPSALQSIANALAGKAVSPLPVIISAAIFLVMIIIVASMIYAMIRSSIISVGRNPMSQSAVYRDLIQMAGLVLVILAVGLIAIFMILTRL